jgi:4-amino-4-deoxy-L-arabinose transferase-like glycosyltransferase
MAEAPPEPRRFERLASLALILEGALLLRVLVGDAVQWFLQTQHEGSLCLFPDTNIYWALAGAIRDGEPYEILEWRTIPHFALRTPGYPLFLAACRLLFGDRPLAVRLVQAVLGAVSVWLVYRLAQRFVPGEDAPMPRSQPRGWTTPLAAAALAAFNPYYVATAALILSEAVFVPLMLAGLWGLAWLWPSAGAPAPAPSLRRAWPRALATGLAWGAAVLVRPSCALLVPAVLVAWVAASGRGRRASAMRGAAIVVLGVVVVMAPWWVRNARIFGRFVPTALWVGASLYDGLNPRATGASDMDAFLIAPDIWPLEEETQDAVLRARALAFVRAHPGRALHLAWIKLGRYWSPWPNAAQFRSPVVTLASASFTVPLLALLALGCWDRRRDWRALVLLAGPLLYFCALHLVFASSMRYRIPAEVPAVVLAAIGLRRLARRG